MMIDYDNSSYLGPPPENYTYFALGNCSTALGGCPARGGGHRGQPSELPPYLRIVATTVCAVILTLGTAGNVLVTAVVWRTKELRNSTNLFLINLSVADLLVLLVCVPPVLVELEQPEVWLLGEGMCKAVPYVQLTAAHGSILTILAISFERYYAICQPLKAGYTCTQMRALAIIGAVWLVAGLLTSPVLATVHYEMVESLADGTLVPACLQMVDQAWQKLYYLGIIALFFGVPFLVLLVVYCCIAKHLVLGGNRRALASSSEESQMRARKQVVFMLVAVVVSFFVCLLPFRIFTIYLILSTPDTIREMGMETYYGILYFSRLLLYMNSALNPILYNAISSKFRGSVVRLLRCTGVRMLTRQITKGTTTTSSTATTGGSVKNQGFFHHHQRNSGKREASQRQLRVSVNSGSLFGERGPKPEEV